MYARQLQDGNLDIVNGLVLVGGWRWGVEDEEGREIYQNSILPRIRSKYVRL